MRTSICALLLIFVSSPSAEVVQDSLDFGRADSLYLVMDRIPDAAAEKASFSILLNCTNDANLIRAMAVGFHWDNKDVDLDSAVVSPVAKSSFNFQVSLYRSESRDSSNKYHNFEFFAASMADAGLKQSDVPQLLATYYFSSKSWSKYSVNSVDTQQFSPGTYFTVVTSNRAKYRPFWPGRLTVYDANRPCCLSYRGNVDGDPSGVVDISDFTYLLAHLFTVAAPTYPCPEAANVDGSSDGKVDLNDVQALVDFLYGSMTPPAPCPE